MKVNVTAGDVFLVPALGGYVPGKVLFRSRKYRGVILVALYRIKLASIEGSLELPMMHSDLLYTGTDPISEGRWIKVASREVSEDEAAMSERIIAGSVWIGDECKGKASDAQISAIPRMLVLGAALVERRAAALLGTEDR